MKIEALETPEVVAVPGGSITLTHTCMTLAVDPRRAEDALVVRTMKGFIVDGQFQDWGPQVAEVGDKKALEDLLSDTTGGRKAGEFSSKDVLPAIAKRKAEKVRLEQEAAEAAKPVKSK